MTADIERAVLLRPLLALPDWANRLFYPGGSLRHYRATARNRVIIELPDGSRPCTAGILYAFGWALYRELVRVRTVEEVSSFDDERMVYRWRFGRAKPTTKRTNRRPF